MDNDYDIWGARSDGVFYPKFIRCSNVVCVTLLVLRVVGLLVGLVISFYSGSVYRSPILDQQSDYPVFWLFWHICVVLAAVFVSVFISACIAAGVAWVYRCVCKLVPVPTALEDWSIKEIPVGGWFLAGYSLVFSGLTVGGLVSLLSRMVESGKANEVMKGLLVLTSPFILLLGIGLVVLVVVFSALLVPCSLLVRNMIDYVRRPSIRKSDLEGDNFYE